MTRSVTVWQRNNSNNINAITKEDSKMATGGTAEETRLSPAARQALERARRALQPHEDDGAIGGLLGKIDGALGEPEGDEVEKSVANMHSLRVALSKSDASPEVRERVERAYRDVGVAHLMKSGGAYGERSAREHIERTRLIEGGRAA